jgi:hypothetical protein
MIDVSTSVCQLTPIPSFPFFFFGLLLCPTGKLEKGNRNAPINPLTVNSPLLADRKVMKTYSYLSINHQSMI